MAQLVRGSVDSARLTYPNFSRRESIEVPDYVVKMVKSAVNDAAAFIAWYKHHDRTPLEKNAVEVCLRHFPEHLGDTSKAVDAFDVVKALRQIGELLSNSTVRAVARAVSFSPYACRYTKEEAERWLQEITPHSSSPRQPRQRILPRRC